MKLFACIGKLFNPPARPEVVAAQQSAARVKEASEQFIIHTDALADMVRKMKGANPKRQKRARS